MFVQEGFMKVSKDQISLKIKFLKGQGQEYRLKKGNWKAMYESRKSIPYVHQSINQEQYM